MKLTPEECFGDSFVSSPATLEPTILHGDAIEIQSALAPDSFDAVITDPPYGLKFLGSKWDHGVPGPAFWTATLRVAKPGAFLVAFGGTRKYHRLACAIEDAGWEIRDCLCWLYGQGYPKNKGALKPGWEPIILARRPGPKRELRIDACRVDVARAIARPTLVSSAVSATATSR